MGLDRGDGSALDPGGGGRGGSRSVPAIGGWSLHVALLPHLEATTLYHAINFQERPFLEHSIGSANSTVARTSLAGFLCPSDGNLPSRGSRRPTSYAGKIGRGYFGAEPYRVCDNGAISFLEMRSLRLADFGDGLSQTATMAEWLLSPHPPSRIDPRRTVFQWNSHVDSSESLEAYVGACRDLDPRSAMIEPEGRGWNWQHGTIAKSLYDYAGMINGRCCTSGAEPLLGVVSAASLHGPGANVLFADGRVDFVAETIAPPAWRALGTRNGGDIAP
jgi:prepilin-type processing-associated H-X9-DG protein